MWKIILLLIIILFWAWYSIFIIFFRLKLNKLEKILETSFKKRNYKIISLFFISEKFLNKHSEIFEEFKNLKKKDFSENVHNFYFENKMDTYKKIHKEINFIFRICENNELLKRDENYNFIKEEILRESNQIWKKYDFYKEIIKKYKFHHKISKFMLIWLFIR